MFFQYLEPLLNVDRLATVMVSLVAFIAICVAAFASRYLKGDSQYRPFFVRLVLLVLSVSVMVSADHLALLFVAWCAGNLLLVRLMVHKPEWSAARASGWLAMKNFAAGAFFVWFAFFMFYAATGETGIQAVMVKMAGSPLALPALALLLAGAMTQSAIWPFHKWLISSLNSPTPVSAVMHAGLVNGGGFLLARFAPLYLAHPGMLDVLFVIGLVSAMLGTLWKLMQSDVKRMLACSTMGQMGFMMLQCGLGLFGAAVAHLVWHGMFKAYLFLSSGGAAQERRFDPEYPPRAKAFLMALVCGLAGALAFAYTSGHARGMTDTAVVMVVIGMVASTQFALPLLRDGRVIKLPAICLATVLAGMAYGYSVRFSSGLAGAEGLISPQPLSVVHITGLAVLVLLWLGALFLRPAGKAGKPSRYILAGYVSALNAAQPHPSTVTAYRNAYKY